MRLPFLFLKYELVTLKNFQNDKTEDFFDANFYWNCEARC